MEHQLIAALKGEAHSETPVWFMRQTGRYQKEYRELRERTSFLELCKSPELIAQVTTMAVDMLDVDAAIIFSDLLTPLEPMGLQLDYPQAGPTLSPAVRTLSDVQSLKPVDFAKDLAFLGESLQLTRERLDNRVPLIGFAGSPFTLACYMIEGQGSRNFIEARKRFYGQDPMIPELLNRLTDMIAGYVAYQIESGAQAIQIFDTWAGLLNTHDYEKWVLPCLQKIFAETQRYDVPGILYINGSSHLLSVMKKSGADCLSIDWRMSLPHAREIVGPDIALQGNLDPVSLFATPEAIEQETKAMVESMAQDPAYVFNLGHGILPETPVENVQHAVKMVKQYGQKKILNVERTAAQI